MALTDKDVNSIASRFKDGEGIGALALAFEVSPAAVRYHLKKKGLIGESEPEETRETDSDLGIGEEDAANSSAALAALMANPALQKLIDAAVAARVAQLVPSSAPAGNSDAFNAFTQTLTHLIEVQSMQQAGYIKPLSAEEVDRRAAGYVEMKALLAKYEAENTPPLYLLGDGGFFECANAVTYEAGQQIRTYIPPAENFLPKNAQAEKVHAAMLQWIGGTTPDIGEQVESAMIASKQAPLVTGALNGMPKRGPVEVVDAPVQDVRRKRVAGTLVQERHGIDAAGRAMGPSFVSAG
jgi:hypothetical protein